MTNITRIALITLFGAVLAVPVLAQTQSAPNAVCGMGQGRNCMQNGSGPGAGAGNQGAGMGRHGGHGMHGGQNGGRGGAALMTPEERTAHQAKMRAVKTYDECKTVQAEFRSTMESRAKDKGVTLPTPRQNACDNLKARGLIK